MLASVCKWALSVLWEAPDEERCCCGGEEDDCGDVEGIAIRREGAPFTSPYRASRKGCRWLAVEEASDSTEAGKINCAYCRRYMSVAKARARHGHGSGLLQMSKARLEVPDFPTDGERRGSSQ